jgi:anti-sigma factor RsiW
MTDRASRLTERELADLAALADGSLPVERRAAVEAWVAASADLEELLDRQRRALSATRALAEEPRSKPSAKRPTPGAGARGGSRPAWRWRVP